MSAYILAVVAGEAWPQDIQNLINEIGNLLFPFWDYFKANGSLGAEEQTIVEAALKSADENGAELNKVIRELEKIEYKMKVEAKHEPGQTEGELKNEPQKTSESNINPISQHDVERIVTTLDIWNDLDEVQSWLTGEFVRAYLFDRVQSFINLLSRQENPALIVRICFPEPYIHKNRKNEEQLSTLTFATPQNPCSGKDAEPLQFLFCPSSLFKVALVRCKLHCCEPQHRTICQICIVHIRFPKKTSFSIGNREIVQLLGV